MLQPFAYAQISLFAKKSLFFFSFPKATTQSSGTNMLCCSGGKQVPRTEWFFPSAWVKEGHLTWQWGEECVPSLLSRNPGWSPGSSLALDAMQEGGREGLRLSASWCTGPLGLGRLLLQALTPVSNVQQEYWKTLDRDIYNIHILHTVYGHTHNNICHIFKAYSIDDERMHACHYITFSTCPYVVERRWVL